MNLSLMLRSLGHRNYRLFFIGQGISLIGTWIQQIAMGWLVYRLTNSALLLGVVGFTGQIPVFLLTPFIGVIVDRWSRHRIMVVTQILAMVQALALAILVATGSIAIWHIIALSLVLGIVGAFDAPARQAFVIDMIGGKKDLGNAIALNSILFNSARLIGPLIAGVLIASVGEEACFFINSLTYIVAIAALLAMEITPAYREESEKDVLKDFTEGLNYVVNFPPTRLILLLLAVVSLAGMPYVVLMPVFATEVLKGGSEMFAFLMSASGVGALFGAVYLASRTTVVGLMRQLAVAAAVFGAGLVIFAFSRAAWLSLAILVLVGFSMIVHAAACNTVLQTVIDDGKRGRVMGFYVMSMMGMMPFGSLIAGSLASRIGAPYTLVIGGAVTFFAALAFYSKLPYLRGIVRPIYSKIGIIPES